MISYVTAVARTIWTTTDTSTNALQLLDTEKLNALTSGGGEKSNDVST
jgi:hypothetical protein